MAGIFDADKASALKKTEVGDTITVAESLNVPFTRTVPRGAAPKQLLATYPCQVYPKRGFAGQLDGTDQTTFSKTNRLPVQATGMWLRTLGYMASKLAQLTAAGGVPDKKEVAKQKADDGIILSQMLERQLLSTQDCAIESGSTPYTSRGALEWLKNTAQTTLPVHADLRPSAGQRSTGALSALTPVAFEAILAACYGQKNGPVDLKHFCGLALKGRMSKWAQHDTDVSGETVVQRFNLNASEKMFMTIVDFFRFDAGMVTNILCNYLACDATTGEPTAYTTRSGVGVDLDMWELCFLQPQMLNELPDLGGGPRGFFDEVHMLKCLNPLGQFSIYTNS